MTPISPGSFYKVIRLFKLWLWLGCLTPKISQGQEAVDIDMPRYIDQVPESVMVEEGDIYIGHLSASSHYSVTTLCKSDLIEPYQAQLNLAASYGLSLVNKNPNLLPNITLGIVTLDTCAKALTSIGQALKLLPQNTIIDPASSSKKYQVVGVIGPYRSTSSSYTAGLFNIFQIPMISPTSSADDLSDRNRYGNFFRVVAPDSFQTKAIVDLLAFFNWTYVSVVYEESNYGFNCLIHMKKYIREAGICIADAIGIQEEATAEDYDFTILKLLKHKGARVVVNFIGYYHTKDMVAAYKRKKAQGTFTFIISDGTTESHLRPYGKAIAGSLNINFHALTLEGHKEFVDTARPLKNPKSPWLMRLWKIAFGCEEEDIFDVRSDCSTKTMKDVPGYIFDQGITVALAPIVFGTALDALIRDHCPEAFRDKTALKTCVKSSLLIEYVKQAVVDTNDGPLAFDEYGAMVQGYGITQVSLDNEGNTVFRKVARWTQGSLRMFEDQLRWYPVDEKEDVRPESVCAKPCKPGEFLVQGELKCCWDCFKCRDNEYVTNNGTGCAPCEYLLWPHEDTFLDCIPIEPSFLWWTDKYGIGLTAMAALGLGISFAVAAIMRKNRKRKVIKGSSLNMMAVINTGLLMIFTTVLLFIARPTFYLCLASRVGFNLSCTFVFAPLLVKTNRLYQIFRASSKLTKVGPTAKGGVSTALVIVTISLEMIIIGVCSYIWPISALESMPVLTTKYVELSCQQEMVGLLIPLSYNLLILLVCCLFAFLTRTLPDNFNESWYILLSVSATLFVWMAFLPTYFSAFYASHKVALLGLALVLNGLITVTCFFATKFYALWYIDEKDIKVTNFSTESFEAPEIQKKTDG